MSRTLGSPLFTFPGGWLLTTLMLPWHVEAFKKHKPILIQEMKLKPK